jgi:cell wall-associated NlpC family hydrolase
MSDTRKVATEALKIIDSGKYKYGQSRAEGYLKDDMMDCSEFVYQSYHNAGFSTFPALSSKSMSTELKEVTEPQAGDIVYWSIGHVAIVEDPAQGTFLGAQSAKSGLRRDNYKTGWWSRQAGRKFLRYVAPIKE